MPGGALPVGCGTAAVVAVGADEVFAECTDFTVGGGVTFVFAAVGKASTDIVVMAMVGCVEIVSIVLVVWVVDVDVDVVVVVDGFVLAVD